MTTVLSTKGQVVLPQPLRKKLGLRPGTQFVCLIREGHIVLKPEIRPVKKAHISSSKVTRLPVIIPPVDAPPMTPETVAFALTDFP